jgi:hypothetical protein
MISTFDGSVAKNIAAPPRKGSHYNRWGGISPQGERIKNSQGLAGEGSV